ncbi:CDK-activating kinase assembly factor MAT1 isoform X1 [Caretta caretta]|uniref:CDK-activating kinase assembly factor MAT1 isoform X1 n=1 Tax=Caretta caretta TaxID=8467 RepID=UPI0020963A2E|nr:CDK-activating kinase assembly factor MAT1 isoform X2 [Caretta caretta]
MDDQGCPRCKTTKYRNPSLKLMVNVCGHTLCESCVELLFVRGAGNCQECDTPLRKSNFRVQLFEDPAIDKEVEIRKKVLKVYNKREDDFPSLTEYNDFLEEVEEIVFNLTNNVDLENTKKKMDNYQKDNKEVIQKNKIKLTREQEELEEALEVERQENEQRRLFIQKEEQMQQIIKRKNKQALLDELESSHLPASLLLAQHKDRSTKLEMQLEKPRPVKPVTFSTGIKMTQHISLAPIQKLEEALYEYQPLQVETYGPQVPETELLGRLGCQCFPFSSAVVLCGAGHARNLGSCKNTVKRSKKQMRYSQTLRLHSWKKGKYWIQIQKHWR